jgi:CheY-like chemotaxis protein
MTTMPEMLQVLLVEDNEGDVEMTERAVRNLDPAWALSVAHNGEEALDFLMKRGCFAGVPTPEIILLDINMPRMDGKRFLEAMKAEPGLRFIPVIMLTSSQSPKDVRDCYERYANCYVVKPFDGKEFITKVREVLGYWSRTSQLPCDSPA